MIDKNRPLALNTADPTSTPAAGESFQVLKADTDGNLWMRVRSSNGAITGDSPDSDNLNPANIIALDVLAFLAALGADGNLDRLRADGDDADDVTTETIGVLKVLARLTGFNGVTFDRLRSAAASLSAVSPITEGGLITNALLRSIDLSTENLQPGLSTGTDADALTQIADSVLIAQSVLRLYNGATFDRARSGGNDADGVSEDTTGILKAAVTLLASNGTTLDRLRSGANNTDAVAVETAGILKNISALLGFNGTTLDRLRSGGTDSDNVATESAGILKTATVLLGLDGSTYDRIKSDANNGDGVANGGGNLQTIGFNFRSNNSSWDRWHGPFQFTLLSSAARTASVNSSDIDTKPGHIGCYFLVNVSDVPGAAPSLSFKLQALDELSGNYFDIWTGDTVITAVGQYLYLVYPGVVTATDRYNAPLPDRWRIQVVHGNANSVTYSVAADGTGP